jgi:hypothetical protein
MAQTQALNKWYITTVDLTVKSTPLNNNNKDSAVVYRVRPGTKFTVIDISNNDYRILFGYYGSKGSPTGGSVSSKAGRPHSLRDFNFDTVRSSNLTRYPRDSAFIQKWANFKIFSISAKDLSEKSVIYYTGDVDFTYGALTLPLKIRFGNGGSIYSAYEENLNFGLTFGLKYTIPSTKPQSINLLGLIGATSVNLDSVAIKDPKFYSSKITSTKAVSVGAGLVYQYSSFQVGLFVGIDHISGELGRQWKHQDRPWLGIGIGVALFNKDSAAKSSSVTNTP